MESTIVMVALVFCLGLTPPGAGQVKIDAVAANKAEVESMVATRVSGGFDVDVKTDGKRADAMQIRSNKAQDGPSHNIKMGAKGPQMPVDISEAKRKAKSLKELPRQVFKLAKGTFTVVQTQSAIYAFVDPNSMMFVLRW